MNSVILVTVNSLSHFNYRAKSFYDFCHPFCYSDLTHSVREFSHFSLLQYSVIFTTVSATFAILFSHFVFCYSELSHFYDVVSHFFTVIVNSAIFHCYSELSHFTTILNHFLVLWWSNIFQNYSVIFEIAQSFLCDQDHAAGSEGSRLHGLCVGD
jgi:hypothetical protein